MADSDTSQPPQLDGFSRALGRFINTLGPGLLAVLALLAGVAALVITAREEEPQIVVPLADVIVSAPGLSAAQVERQVATPLENLLFQIDGVEYVYSASRPGMAVVTVRFFVGEDRENSLVKIYNKMHSNLDLVPDAVHSWIVKPIEIDDVPIVVATLWSDDPDRTGSFELRRIAEEVALRLQSVRNTNRVDVKGGQPRELRVELNPEALSARRTAPLEIAWALGVSNKEVPAGTILRDDMEIVVEAGPWLRDAREVGELVVNVVDGQPVYLKDVATVVDGPAEPDSYTWLGFGPASEMNANHTLFPAVSVAVAKRRGSNAVWVSRDVLAAIEQMRDEFFPPHVHMEVIRDNGRTANQKVGDLVKSLLSAVLIVVLFIGMVMGWRSALVVGVAVPLCYGVTLGVNYLTGYTINRVTLFALILALGLLVDDPITGIDNIDRYLRMNVGSRVKAILLAMQEIRLALIMSTIAIILCFVPLFFITGMMGPYMAPMAVNVPLAVIMSTFVAFLITPWLGSLLLKPDKNQPDYDVCNTLLYRLYNRILRPIISSRRNSLIFLGAVGFLFVLSNVLTVFRLVPLKLLPFDNKDEFQIVVDMPEGTSVERTDAVMRLFAEYLRTVPEVRAFAGFSGLPSPMDFNGMVRHYYMRDGSHSGDIRVTLAERLARRHKSHEIVLRIRRDLEQIARQHGARLKVVQTPPGPPVVSTIAVELYGDAVTPYDRLQEAARAVAERMAREPFVTDVDTSVEFVQPRLDFEIDREKAALSGVSTEDTAQTVALALDGYIAGHIESPHEANPLPIRVQLPRYLRSSPLELETINLKGMPGIVKLREQGGIVDAPQPLVPLGEIGSFTESTVDQTIHHKNLKRVAYAYAEIAGRAPADAIQDMYVDLDSRKTREQSVERRNYLMPGGGDAWTLPNGVRAVWSGEGEWYITIKVFRDLGIAFGVALIGIFIVLSIQTGSPMIAVIIMLAIPLSMIGIMPGFWVLNQIGETQVAGYPNPSFFTATAMIGMIALAGIVVRNSLILVEFIHQSLCEGNPLEEALIQAGAIRMRPVFLTAGTTLLGNLVITLDPIFNGLAWAIIFGISASTLFTLGVIPVVYCLVYANRRGHGVPVERKFEE